jgi:hypothetical protein
MNIVQQNLKALLSEKALYQAKLQFESGIDISSIELFDMDYRFHRPTVKNINLEVLTMRNLENNNPNGVQAIGMGSSNRVITFFKPIGFYSMSQSDPANIEVTIFREFENDYNRICSEENYKPNFKVNFLSLIENAYIAAFSKEVSTLAVKFEDATLYVNGLKVDIYKTSQGFSNVFLDDRYGLQGAVASYTRQSDGRIYPGAGDMVLFNKFSDMKLFSGF